ncbi:PepSY domain-containing protein [Ornithinibacillus halophilus]|uniref:Uncharacterized membrane protein YkoI n=1 Tax=Ornithinibacillus halophilus TaxID=930117 RepID=A0A1M5FSE6_9BACI|nr:PepSY domain-containing protein [Ornithinibacillus halophilus]SHF94460.1 Uncharacterized membrane protein YkoI [Ornithinibacillus halophilus]
MNRKILTSVVTIGILLGGGATIMATSIDGAESSLVKKENIEVNGEKNTTKQILTASEAKEIALSEHDGRIDSIELEYDDGYSYYEVEIENKAAEYDVYVDAYTGEVLGVETDDINDDYTHSTQDMITSEEAIEIALKQVEGKVVEIEFDEDDGRFEYEIELKTDKGEAEITIDAITGEVRELEID